MGDSKAVTEKAPSPEKKPRGFIPLAPLYLQARAELPLQAFPPTLVTKVFSVQLVSVAELAGMQEIQGTLSKSFE